jgi:hypothetical protein
MMEYKVEGSRRNKKFVEAILPSMISQLKLENCTKAVVIRIADECDGNQGITVDLSELTGCYMVVIKPTRKLKDIGLTLAHEMVHVKQLAKGILKNKRNGVNIWAGKAYSKKTAYLDMPWEIEAFSKQELILRRAFEE